MDTVLCCGRFGVRIHFQCACSQKHGSCLCTLLSIYMQALHQQHYRLPCKLTHGSMALQQHATFVLPIGNSAYSPPICVCARQ